MADQPQNPQNPNAGRISSMLQDLAAQRGDQAAGAPAAATRPAPVNLPTGQAGLPTAPVRVPVPAAIEPQRPPVATPRPPPLVPLVPTPPAGAVLPTRPTPPPAPREIAATTRPKPATPPPPPPLAPPPTPPLPKTAPPPVAPAVTSELRTMSGDIGRIQVGQPPAGVRPASPAVVPAPLAPAVAPQISAPLPIIIPPASSGGGGKKVLFIGLGLLVLAVVAVTVWSFFGSSGQIAEETPTPSAAPTLTTTPQGKNLSSYFGLPKATATITSTETAVTDLRNALLTAQPAAKQGLAMAVQRSGAPMAPGALMSATMGAVPVDLSGSFGTDWVALIFGQTEAFDGAGQPLTDSATQPTLALVIEVADASKANQAMQAWEGTGLDAAAEKLFGYTTGNAIAAGFNSGTYREVLVRFRNFPYADVSLDWALALGSNGKNYLILTGSRESAFFVVDQLMQ